MWAESNSQTKRGNGYAASRRSVLDRDDYTCQECGCNVGSMDSDLTTAHTHHITPRSEGGSDAPENLVTLCRNCHNEKHDTGVVADRENHESQSMPLDENPNWKGGRSVTSHGYVLVKRPDHPGAQVNGYVYEHRLVAEEKLGRRLRSGEHVHHRDGDRKNNAPENLEVLAAAEHRARHRNRDDLRDPGEANPTIRCACGCGESLKKYDQSGRPREYVSGHNSRVGLGPLQGEVLEVLAGAGPRKRSDLAAEVDATGAAVTSALRSLREKGRVESPKRGYWALPGSYGPEEWTKENRTIECACGCGETLQKYDNWGRERKYISGHNSSEIDRSSPVQDAVCSVLKTEGTVTRSELDEKVMEQTDTNKSSIGAALRRLRKRGVVGDGGYGKWSWNGTKSNRGGR